MNSQVRVLVVEHERSARATLTQMVGTRGYECTAVPNVDDARRALASSNYMLVLCDVQAPGSGLELLRDVATAMPNTATVAVTRVDDSSEAWEAMEQGAYGYVVKPFRPNEILINVVSALKRLELEKKHRGRAIDLESKLIERGRSLNHAIAKLRSYEETDKVIVLDRDVPDETHADAGTIRALLDVGPTAKVVTLGEADGPAVTEGVKAARVGILDEDRGLEEVVEAIKAAHAGEVEIPLWRPSAVNRPAEHGVPPTNLTKRELEVLGLLAEGFSNAALAERLSIRMNTVRNHIQRILEKLGAHSKLEAVTTSLRTGVVKVPIGL